MLPVLQERNFGTRFLEAIDEMEKQINKNMRNLNRAERY